MGLCQAKIMPPPSDMESLEKLYDDLNRSLDGLGTSQRQRLARYREMHVSEMYDTHQVIGEGSMGEIFVVTKKLMTVDSESFVKLSDLVFNDYFSCSSYSLAALSKAEALRRAHTSKGERTKYACKTMNTSRMRPVEMMEFINEIEILRDLDHPNIVQLFEVYRESKKIWIIMEFCSGGDLSSGDIDLNEAKVIVVLEQILRALTYMHERHICHRDIKLENIVFADSNTNAEVKLIDFGLSNKFVSGEKMIRECGTVYTAAPELLMGQEYTEKTDIWAIGVVAFILLSKTYPFLRDADDMQDDFKVAMLRDARFIFGPEWKIRRISKLGKEFVSRCFSKNPDARWTALEALQFVSKKWIPQLARLEMQCLSQERNPHVAISVGKVDKSPVAHSLSHTIASKTKRTKMEDVILSSMAKFVNYGEFKKTVLVTMAYNMDKKSLRELRDLFHEIDASGTGIINLESLQQVLTQIRSNSEVDANDDRAIQQLFAGISQNHSGQIHYVEFLAAVCESHGLITIERLAEAFDRLDVDGKGFISKQDLQALLGIDYNEDLAQKMINEADFKKDNRVDREDFLQLMLADSSTLKQ